ncbi:excalibur calcium-binding domain-containing protein [Corynebacterium aquilae]|nr:excalibur calcium-binding domain-containing protein [Corynebacterium aquilae]
MNQLELRKIPARTTGARYQRQAVIFAMASVLALSACGFGDSEEETSVAPTTVTETSTVTKTVTSTKTVTETPLSETVPPAPVEPAAVQEPTPAEQPPAEQPPAEPAPQLMQGFIAPPPPAPEPAAGSPVANCKEARARGIAPIHKGSPYYSSKLDGDGDGIACE